MKYIIAFVMAGFLSAQLVNPAVAAPGGIGGGQKNPDVEKEFMEAFKKECADFPDKLEKCSPFTCEVNTDAHNDGKINVKNVIKGIGGNGLCHFVVETFVNGMPPLTYSCQYSDTTRALVVRVARKQLASLDYKPSKEDEKLMIEANKKDCHVAGLDNLMKSLQIDEGQKKQLLEAIEKNVKSNSDGLNNYIENQKK